MKKILSIALALMMIISAAALAVSAEIIYEDDFSGEDFNFYDHSTGEGFWFTNKQGQSGMGKFEQSNGCMNGWEDAQNGFCQYFDGEEYDGSNFDFADKFPCMREFTEWFDLKLDEGGVGEVYCFGLVFSDCYNKAIGYANDPEHYYAALYAKDESDPENPHNGFVRLTLRTEAKDKKLRENYTQDVNGSFILGEYDIPGMDDFNLNGEAVRIGIRYGNGNITMYANGKIVATFDRNTIGLASTPAVWLQNGGCYVEFDNYALATYDHNVKKATRLDSYDLYEGQVVITDGENAVGKVEAAEDDVLTISAPAVSGKKFVKWDSISIGGSEITDFEKAELLYGISLGDLESEQFEMTMPDCDVELKAVYEDAPTSGYLLTAIDIAVGERYVEAGETVTLTAAEPDEYMEGKVFQKWVVNKGAVELSDPTSKTITFTMPAEDVEVQAIYGDGSSVLPGDANGDGKLNNRDVILVMKAVLAQTAGAEMPSGFVKEAADMDGNGKLNNRDVIAVMKAVLAASAK